jgi:transposase
LRSIPRTIELGLSRGRNAVAIWQDLVDQHGFADGFQSVKRFVRKLRGVWSPEACGVILTKAGEEAQVDYGTGPLVRDPQSGKYRRTRLFVLTLGFSRKSVRLLVFRSSAQTWAQLHERAFRRLGGTMRVVVLDNLREGVLSPDIYDPSLNPLYRDVLAHYGAVAMPCRIQDPDRKGKVEAGVGHTQKTPLKGLRFESLEEAQAYLDRWEERWADTRIHGTTKRQVAAMFAEEKPALQPLPLEPFRYYQYGERTVHLDVASKWKRPTTARRQAGSAAAWQCSGMASMSACSIRKQDSCCARICAKSAAAIGLKTRIGQDELRSEPCNCWRAPKGPGRTSARCLMRCTVCN